MTIQIMFSCHFLESDVSEPVALVFKKTKIKTKEVCRGHVL